ncbi:MAG: adenylate/guanylate cyclase domain-containing protein [Mesorhizobium sp.]|uniref:ATP-binding protein n=2 Tax=unclassified Mesorhizobium TaxID=325217 RepID=UPI000FE3AA9F|nr:AAA family ATPase [Mesorhizobium sp.]RWK24103.1 MAG: adenylate/guanylate cyclase domain-containing protein [Mesorhizobium sp.]RWK32127.1 MAG: adenylate/guanylate cyclase domain-containing protein [Mesorhizobium sp.]TIQ44113.1 MAG: adenylate/guanylate cyclase domain-containing protein [Mesorhizobium sp.]
MSEQPRVQRPIVALAKGVSSTDDSGVSDVRSERRVMTALCYDLVGSTDLLAVLDIEDYEELMSAFRAEASQAISSYSGVVVSEAGDGGVALFPAEMEAKDAASQAIRAGLEIIEACKRVGLEKDHTDLHVRVGIATSMILVHGDGGNLAHASVTGPALAMATRLQAMAQPDAVLVSDETRNLARRSHVFSFGGIHAVKGFAEPERTWRAISHKRDVDRFFAFGRLNNTFIGRRHELVTIAACWDDAVAGKGSVILVEGEAGIGKSRLLYEVRKRTRFQRAKLLLFQCQPGGSHSALYPLLQNVRSDLAGKEGRLETSDVAEVFANQSVHDDDVVGIFSFLLGAEGSNPALKEADLKVIREKATWAARRSIEAICERGPLILVVEDIHWIDPTSRQLLAELALFIQRLPVLLIMTARPGSEIHSGFRDLPHITLKPLDREETRQAIMAMRPEIGSAAHSELISVVVEVTGGVPLFIEEICQWIAENAASITDRLTPAASSSRISVFEGILEARLEALGPAKDVARAGAVAGNRFNLGLLRKLLPEYSDETIGNALDTLSEAGFLIRVRPSGEPDYGFRHALIRETIYNTLLRRRRQALHQSLFSAVGRNRSLGPWLGTAELAEHAERAGLIEEAIDQYIAAGRESYDRSAMAEARQILDHAMTLCQRVRRPDKQDVLRLAAMMPLGPILTATEGPNSLPARKLYEDGVEIARRRPLAERAKWFPIYWGWWFTGPTIDGERARTVLTDLRDVDDPEVQFQARHCVWAIEFNLGHHKNCIAAVDEGLALYGTGQRAGNATLFGGHDARVCGLSHRGLSQWFTGRAASAVRSLAEARSWAMQTAHVGSIAHVYINEAMLDCYRRDFSALRGVIADIRELTKRHHLPSLAALAQILEGWCEGNAARVEQGRDQIKEGLAIHGELQTPEDYPVYYGMLAELLARTGEIEEALTLVSSAAAEAEAGGSLSWLAELYRRKAHLLLLSGSSGMDIVAALSKSLAIADEQNAVPILLNAYEMLRTWGVSEELSRQYRSRVGLAKSAIEQGAALFVNREPSLRH